MSDLAQIEEKLEGYTSDGVYSPGICAEEFAHLVAVIAENMSNGWLVLHWEVDREVMVQPKIVPRRVHTTLTIKYEKYGNPFNMEMTNNIPIRDSNINYQDVFEAISLAHIVAGKP